MEQASSNVTIALEIENQIDIAKRKKFNRHWLIFYAICLVLSIILLIICFAIPVTGSFLVYVIILLFISIDVIVTMTRCKNGMCCISQNKTINKIDDILKLLTTIIWILAFTICILCGLSNIFSAYIIYNRWEEALPLFIAAIIQITLIKKIFTFRNNLLSSNKKINIKNIVSNFNAYHDTIVTTSNCECCFGLKWLFLLFSIVLAFLIISHSIQKSNFINTFPDRNTYILETKHYGAFEYECMGYNDGYSLPMHMEDSSIPIITISGMSSRCLSFNSYNKVLWNEYGMKNGKKLVICGYNRGGFGFTPTKEYNAKLIEPEVNHLFEIADQLFGKNSSFHLMGHSRGGLNLLQAKMSNYGVERVESIVVIDGFSNANVIKNGLYDRVFNGIPSYAYVILSIAVPFSTFSMLKPMMELNKECQPDYNVSAKYSGFRDYMYQSSAWESRDLLEAWRNTVSMYEDTMENNNNFTFDPVLNVKCSVEYNTTIRYSLTNNTLYVKTTHGACVYDRNIANMTFYYNDNGLKEFYDMLFL